jgi:glycosyltransferase involved in cell wall biosynthesis
MVYFAADAGVTPIVINEMSREIGPRDLIVVARLLRQLWRFQPHIVHTHKAKAGAVGRVAAFLYRWLTPSALWLRPRPCRIVHTFHGHIFHSYYGPFKTRLFVAIERVLARVATDRIITISEQQRREIGDDFRVGSPAQLRVIPLGIDFDESPPALAQQATGLRAEFVLGDEEILVGTAGRLCEVKNYGLLLRAAARVCGDSTIEPYFVIIGDGHLRPELEQLARELGISARVVFTGFRRDASALYRDLDLVALTSLNEGTPLTVIEGLHAGRAVVATAVGGVVDLLGAQQEVSGGLTVCDHGVGVSGFDVETFAEGLRYLIERPQLRQEMGARGRAFVRKRLSKDRLIGEIEALYRELVGTAEETAVRETAAVISK